jgi:peptide/nickel transport system permease protein
VSVTDPVLAVAAPPSRSRLARRAFGRPSGAFGAVLLLSVIGLALIGPIVAPHDITEIVARPLLGPSAEHWLGTDILGRDVWSRLLHGGISLLGVAVSATLIAYAVGAGWGMLASLRSRAFDTLSLAAVDVVLSLPPLVVGLVLLAGAGSGNVVVALALAAIQVPRVFRIVRSAAREVATQDFVEAALARGDSSFSVLRRDVLSNIWTPMLADFGLRVTSSVILFSSLSFLGLGAPPPSADWGLMISENRTGILIQPWGVLAPAILIAMLSVGVNLLTDSFSRAIGAGSSVPEV